MFEGEFIETSGALSLKLMQIKHSRDRTEKIAKLQQRRE